MYRAVAPAILPAVPSVFGGGLRSGTLLVDSGGYLNPYVTTVRASNATAFNSDGILTTYANNIARFKWRYNTTTSLWELDGLLAEGGRTNLQPRSEQFTLGDHWFNATGTSPFTLSNTTETTPSGSTSCGLYSKTGASTGFLQSRAFPISEIPNSSVVSSSVWVKIASGSPTFSLNLQEQGGDFTTYGSTGTITPTSGWVRYPLNGITKAADGNSTRLVINLVGDTGDAIHIWGAQVEIGTFASSYIPTAGAAATRAADAITINDLSTIGFNPAEGTILVEYEPDGNSNLQTVFAVSAGTTSTNAMFYFDEGGNANAFINTSTGTGGRISGPSGGFFAARKVALAYKNLDSCFSVDGTNYTNNTFNIPTGLDRLAIGSLGGTSRNFFGHIRRLTYYPTRLPNAQLQALTA